MARKLTDAEKADRARTKALEEQREIGRQIISELIAEEKAEKAARKP